MVYKLDSEIEAIIVCPQCHQNLDVQSTTIICSGCDSEYKISNSRQPDLRLKSKKSYTLNVVLGELLHCAEAEYKILELNPNPEFKLEEINIPFHLSKELVSFFPKGNGGLVLDLGSGTGLHQHLCDQLGHKYVGLDYNSDKATLKGDAHALPFKDNSFDFIISIAVLEHVQHPYIMMKEVFRVLKPGGKFIGTVSYLEPFHEISYYHHTHVGVCNSLSVAGFKVQNISPMPNWPALKAISQMVLFPRTPKLLISFFYMPLQLLHRIWWKMGNLIKKTDASSEKNRLFLSSGSFSFIANKGS